MNFVTLEFAAFFLVVLLVAGLLRHKPGPYRLMLLCCNLFFYASAGIIFLPLLLWVALLNWGTAKLLFTIGPSRNLARKSALALDIAIHIALLAFFKYYEFLLVGLESLFGFMGFGDSNLVDAFRVTDILFPVGLSFYTFQGISYAVDQYRTPGERPSSFMDVLLFVSFFPTVMAGPILRAGQFFPQLHRQEFDSRSLQEGFALILSGLFKKVVIASYLSEHIVRDVFLAPEIYSSWTILAAVYAYSIQIFCDFSGYSDMAVGIGRLMGYRLPENFRSPYLAFNLQDFWRRWHITLSLWLRDYLYIPLGGSRRGNRYLNLLITMGLGGLWHGSHLRFLVWGLMHGFGLMTVHIFRLLKTRMIKSEKSLPPILEKCVKPLDWILTFHFIAFLWVFFRAEDMDRSLEILRRIFLFGQPGDGFPVLVIPAILAGFCIQLCGRRIFDAFISMQERLPWYAQAVVLSLIGGLILKMGPDGIMPFIYFQF